MDGRERAIILGLYLTAVSAYLIIVALRFNTGTIDFDTFKGEFMFAAGLFLALLIKLPPTKSEAEATANGSTTTENMKVDAENVEVKS